MPAPIVDQVVDFYYALFEQVFSAPFRSRIAERLRRDAVLRQVQDSAGAASQSLTRFFRSQQLTEQQVANVLHGFVTLPNLLTLESIANPNDTPERVVEALLIDLPCPEAVQRADHGAVYRVALHSIVQVLMLVGPIGRVAEAQLFEHLRITPPGYQSAESDQRATRYARSFRPGRGRRTLRTHLPRLLAVALPPG